MVKKIPSGLRMLWLRLVSDRLQIKVDGREYLYYFHRGITYIVKEPVYPIQ